MARITRKFLRALGIEDENVQDQLVCAYREEIDALTEERDSLKAKVEKLHEVEKERDTLKAQLDENGENPFEGKFKALKKEFDDYKADVTAKETKRAKKHEYKALLKEAGVNEKRIDSVLKVTNLDDVELDENGKIKDRDKLKDTIKTEWADFLVETSVQGAKTATPPANNGGKQTMTVKEIRAIKDPAERHKAMAENPELFGLKF